VFRIDFRISCYWRTDTFSRHLVNLVGGWGAIACDPPPWDKIFTGALSQYEVLRVLGLLGLKVSGYSGYFKGLKGV
jgi:hypothetical protein